MEKIVSAVNPQPLDRIDGDHAFGSRDRARSPYNGLEIQMVDLKKLNFDESGLRTIELQNDFAPEDITAQAKPLATAAD